MGNNINKTNIKKQIKSDDDKIEKEHIKCLKSAISCDSRVSSENDNEINKKYESTIKILKEKIEKIESENIKLKNKISKNENKGLSESDKKNIQNATKHFSNILFDAILNNHYVQ